MRNLAFLTLACLAFAGLTSKAAAQTTMPMPMPNMPAMVEHMMTAMHAPQQLSVAATGSVEYVPDVARINLGIRADSPSATTAIDSINKSSAQVIAALKGVGIATGSIKTVGYNLFYRAPPNPAQPSAGATLMANQGGTYEASEALLVSAPVASAGKVLDAAIGAGANESFGLSYQTTNYDSLYRQALAKAVASARATADAMAKAAHVSIVEIQSISNSAEQPGPMMRMEAMPMAMNGANVMPGTDAVAASVFVVYRVR